MSNPNDQSKLSSIKTYILIALVFSIIILIAWLFEAFWNIWIYVTFVSYIDYFGVAYGASAFWLVESAVFFVFLILDVLIFLRIWKMYKAVNSGDIATLKKYNNMLWAILALIFGGVIPGIMLLISFGPINELGQQPMTQASGSYPPPPPPQM